MAPLADVVKPPAFPSLDSIESALWPGAVVLVFAVTAVMVDVMIILSTRFRLVDLPNRRSAHALPTARGGGIAIVIMVCVSALITVFRWPQLGPRVLLGVVLPGLTIASVGIVDDIRPLRPLLRLAIQVGVAAFMTFVLQPLPGVRVPGVGDVSFGPFAWPLTMVWIVGMINAYNFIDGSDGMAGMAGVVVGASMAAVGLAAGSLAAMLLAAFAAAAAGGFLVFNWQPARVFMGDVGSGFLGLFFGAIPLLFAEPRSATFLPAVLCLWPFVYDTLLSVVRRAWHRQNPLQPHREFLFHRLIRSGVPHSEAALLYGLMSAFGGLLGLAMVDPAAPPVLRDGAPVLVALLAAAMTFLIELRCRRVGLPSAATAYSSALQEPRCT
jgi:UDP-N-acetylmuramyl pentapeptide phosphotransferase/UDP-N-acetylglucosamine-1-phosphate transferase